MGELEKRELVNEVASLASAYLGRGIKIPDVDCVDPDDRIRDISDLLVRYFVITGINQVDERLEPSSEQASPEVVPFVKKLPGRIKRIKTATDREIQIQRGTIEGRIDWQETIETRSLRGTTDRTLFACRRIDERVETPENQVLATLIDRIYKIIDQHFESAQDSPGSYSWLKDWIDSDSALRLTVERLKFDHPYISEIDVEERPISGSKLEKVKSARIPLYREAAKLLERFQRYDRGEYTDDDLHGLFNSLFVGPDGRAELFELYWSYKLLHAYDEHIRNPITGSSNVLAHWDESGHEYRLHYRSTGDSPIQFSVPIDDAKQEIEILDRHCSNGATYTQRFREAKERTADIKEEALGKTGVQRNFWKGEPDILLTKRDEVSDELKNVFLGEVKYSESGAPTKVENRASSGIEELMEYIELVRDSKGRYLSSTDSPVRVEGAVFTRDFEPKQSSSQGIRIVTYDDDLDRPF